MKKNHLSVSGAKSVLQECWALWAIKLYYAIEYSVDLMVDKVHFQYLFILKGAQGWIKAAMEIMGPWAYAWAHTGAMVYHEDWKFLTFPAKF